MIGIEGQFNFSASLEGKELDIHEPDLQFFNLIEETGGALPTFELAFETMDSRLIEKLNEGAKLSVTLGDGKGGQKTTNLFIAGARPQRLGSNSYHFTLVGITDKSGYNLNQRVQLGEAKTSTEAIEEAAKRYFRTEIEFQTADQMNWIQHNISDRRFINHCWMHSDLADSFSLLAITHDDRFRLRDARAVAKEEPTIEFGYNSGWRIDPDYEMGSNASFLNSQGAYGIEQVESVVAEHRSFSEVKITQPVSSLLTTSSLNRAKDTPTRRFAQVMRSENMHANYWEAFRRNYSSLAAYSTSHVKLSVQGRVLDVAPADLAMFKDDEANVRAVESYSGLYFVAKVATSYARRNVSTGVILCRENVNITGGNGGLR